MENKEYVLEVTFSSTFHIDGGIPPEIHAACERLNTNNKNEVTNNAAEKAANIGDIGLVFTWLAAKMKLQNALK